jgi:hypothetical protein
MTTLNKGVAYLINSEAILQLRQCRPLIHSSITFTGASSDQSGRLSYITSTCTMSHHEEALWLPPATSHLTSHVVWLNFVFLRPQISTSCREYLVYSPLAGLRSKSFYFVKTYHYIALFMLLKQANYSSILYFYF